MGRLDECVRILGLIASPNVGRDVPAGLQCTIQRWLQSNRLDADNLVDNIFQCVDIKRHKKTSSSARKWNTRFTPFTRECCAEEAHMQIEEMVGLKI